jgi:hypothetical protein
MGPAAQAAALVPGERTLLTVEDEISFLGLARPAVPLAARDVPARWRRSLERLRELAERG